MSSMSSMSSMDTASRRMRLMALGRAAVLAALTVAWTSLACSTPPRRPETASPPLARAGAAGDDGSGDLAKLSRDGLPVHAASEAGTQEPAKSDEANGNEEHAGTRYGDYQFDWSQGPALRSSGTRTYASGYQAVSGDTLGDTGAITGRVTWSRAARPSHASAPPCRQAAAKGPPHAVVYIEDIHRGRAGVLPLGHSAQLGGLLRHRDCQLIPEVQLVSPAGSILRVINEDREPHALRVHRGQGEPWELALPALATRDVPLSEAGLVEVRAQDHDGGAWVVVAEHPYYTVTDSDGRFRLDQVPPGTYTLVVVTAPTRAREHASAAVYRRTVSVKANGAASVAIQVPGR